MTVGCATVVRQYIDEFSLYEEKNSLIIFLSSSSSGSNTRSSKHLL